VGANKYENNTYWYLRQFAKKYDVRILIGEFSCARWAPGNGAYNYIKDCIDWFEEEGWDWIYFCLMPGGCYENYGANAWCIERDTDRWNSCLPNYETDRLTMLRSYFEKNE
jgi:hypothetical protein